MTALAAGRSPGEAAGRAEAVGDDTDDFGVGSGAWHERHFASFRAAELSALRCGSWQVEQLSDPSPSVEQRLQVRVSDG